MSDERHGSDSVLAVMRRGWRASPELREGIGLTILLAGIGAAGRVVIPVLVQQVIDKGFTDGSVDVVRVVTLSLIGAVVAVVATIATMFAARRLAHAGEHALFGLRTRRVPPHPPAVDRSPCGGAPRGAREPSDHRR